jgi:hypothetical protein
MKKLGMKVLVQDCFNRQWLRKSKEWTKKVAEAKIFRTVEAALRFCVHHKVRRAEIVLRFDLAKQGVRIPVSDECRDRTITRGSN